MPPTVEEKKMCKIFALRNTHCDIFSIDLAKKLHNSTSIPGVYSDCSIPPLCDYLMTEMRPRAAIHVQISAATRILGSWYHWIPGS
ncbi:hypothetical protein AKJ16_DCAP20404 [Drosera capensis]